MWLVFGQATFCLPDELPDECIFLFVFYSFQNSDTMMDNCGVLVKGKTPVHFAAWKVTGRTVFY